MIANANCNNPAQLTTCAASLSALVLTRMVPFANMILFGIILQMVALELDELVKAIFAERYPLTRILPTSPCQILWVSWLVSRGIQFTGQLHAGTLRKARWAPGVESKS